MMVLIVNTKQAEVNKIKRKNHKNIGLFEIRIKCYKIDDVAQSYFVSATNVVTNAGI